MFAKKITTLLLISLLTLSACASVESRRQAGPEPEHETTYEGVPIQEKTVEEQNAESEVYGPQPAPPGSAEVLGPPAPAAPAAPVVAPAPAPEAAKLCLILGPGMAKALAEASVLEAIRKAQIPVHCVVGTEMGAVVGALYAYANGSTNTMQWQLFKFNKDNYLNFPVISLREPKSSGHKLHDFLREMFRDKKIEDLPLKFGTVAMDSERDALATFERGGLADALSSSLAMPGIFEPWKVNGVAYVSGAVSSPAPLELARTLGGNFFVLIDVTADTTGAKPEPRFQKAFSPVRSLLKLQRKEASFVIDVKAGAIKFDDFDHQGEILAAGARAAEKSVPDLKAAWEKWNASTH
ncbi:MAG: patatin-like phospholipase family protein [Bdellovibrionota bacterium]